MECTDREIEEEATALNCFVDTAANGTSKVARSFFRQKLRGCFTAGCTATYLAAGLASGVTSQIRLLAFPKAMLQLQRVLGLSLLS